MGIGNEGGRRTQAMRAPAAGGFTPPTSLAASNPCLNCGTNVQLTFCPECGQREIDSDPTLREFLNELAQDLLRWDGKLLRTLRLLFTQPGELTAAYLDGKRVRYISPVRLFLACSVLFFFVSALLPSQPGRGTRSMLVMNSGPVAVFLMLPVFAALVAFFFRDRRRHYPQHLAFSLHVHALAFLAFTVLLLARISSLTSVHLGAQLLVGVGMAAYTVPAAQRVYEGSRASIAPRMLGVVLVYFAVFAAVMLMVFRIRGSAS